MPTYEFRCKQCQNKFTTRVSLVEKEKVACPQCNARDLVQIFTSCSYKTTAVSGCSTPSGSPFS